MCFKNLEGRFFCSEEQLLEHHSKEGDGYKGTHYWIYSFIVSDKDCPLLRKYIKIGFTQQFPTDRLKEWRKKYSNLKLVGLWETSFIKDGKIFYLFDDKVFKKIRNGYMSIKRITREERELISLEYNKPLKDISDEFFNDLGDHDIAVSIVSEIISDYIKNCETGNISDINIVDTLKSTNKIQYKDFELNRLQNDRLGKMIDAIQNKKIYKLLFPAIMRFGKTTVMYELIKNQDYKLSLVLCGEDTSSSWIDDVFNKRFIESDKEGFKDSQKNHFALFTFDGSSHLRAYGDFYNQGIANSCYGERITYEYGFIKSLLEDPENHLVFYISLQDGMRINIKEKHKELSELCADLMVVDETHFAARGKECKEAIKKFTHSTEIHLSATPYTILKGYEFSKDQIIQPVYYEDLIKERDYWYSENYFRPEYENPLFAFPDIRFYTMTKGLYDTYTNKKINASDVFKTKEENGKNIFVNEEQAVAMIESMFGEPGTDGGIVSKKYYEEVNALKHGFIVFDETASCNAFKELFERMYPSDRFEVFIASGDTPDEAAKSVKKLREYLDIRDKNSDNSYKYASGRSLTLTCKKYMCGVTIPQWDFGILWADVKSMEFYNQVWGRLLSRFVDEYVIEDENGNPKKVLISRKDNVCFFDLDFERVARMKVKYDRFNASRKRASGEKVSDDEYNTIKVYDLDNGFSEVDYSEIISKRNESFKKNSIDELMGNITLATLPYSEEYDFYDDFEGKKGYGLNSNKPNPKDEEENENGDDTGKEVAGKISKAEANKSKPSEKDEHVISEEARRSAYGNILRLCLVEYCLNSGMKINSLNSLIDVCKTNNSIKKHAETFGLGIERLVLINMMQNKFHQATYELNELDDNISGMLSYMDGLDDQNEKARVFLKYFGRFSENEVITPDEIVKIMIEYSGFKPGNTLIEIGSKCCEFLLGIVKEYGINAARNITIIPSSAMAKLVIKGIFSILGLDLSKIMPYDCMEYINYINNKEKYEKNNSFKKIKNMKFDIAIGNPPYQNGRSQIYADFILLAQKCAKNVCLITPRAWQNAKNGNGLSKLNNEEFKRDKQFVLIDNRDGVFNGVQGANETNIILWKKGYDNGLDGKQPIYIEGSFSENVMLPIDDNESKIPEEFIELKHILEKNANSFANKDIVSSTKPYGIRAKSWVESLGELHYSPENYDDIAVYCVSDKGRSKIYLPASYNFPKITNSFKKYKVLIAKAWGNWTKNHYDCAYSEVIVAGPNEACSETYVEFNGCDDRETAYKAAKYAMTQFFRACLFLNKKSQNNGVYTYANVPVEDYSEEWWNESIESINENLMDKYSIPERLKEFIRTNIQIKTEKDIL